MSRNIFFALLVVGALAAFGCSSGGSTTAPATPDMSGQIAAPENHVAWGVFDIVLDAESGTASIVWNREAEAHLNVTGRISPPKCYDCVTVTGSTRDELAERWYIELAFRNPTSATGFDVRAVLSAAGGDKMLLNPDGVTSVWGAPMPFRAINVDPERTFGPYEVHGRVFDFYFPTGEKWKGITYIVDASRPGYVEEPLIENGQSDLLVNNGFATTFVRCRIWDHQGDLNAASAVVDLSTIGGSPMTPLFDDGVHSDGAPGDGVFGFSGITTTAAPGYYLMNVFASDMAGHMGWGQVMIEVRGGSGPGNNDPVIDDVTTDWTTAKAPEKIHITVTAHDPDADPITYDFQAESGNLSGQSGGSVYWSPSISKTGPQQITIAVLDDQGGSAIQETYLWSTDMSVISGDTDGFIPDGTLSSVIPSGSVDMAEDFINEVVYMNFWASWCGPCMSEMSELSGIYNHYKDNEDYNHCLINLREGATIIRNVVDQYGYGASYWLSDDSASYYDSTKPFGNTGYIPWHLLFDRDNRCRWAQIGSLSSGSILEDKIDQLL